MRVICMPLAAAVLAVAAASAPAASEPPAQELVKSTTTKVLDTLREEREAIEADPERIYSLVDQYIAPHFDLTRMSRRVLGKYWRKATPEQREGFVREFKTLLTHTYAAVLRQYSDETVTFLTPREREDRNEISVRTEIDLSDGPAIPITYELYLTDGAWKVYDVSIDGISLVINYRSTFKSEVRLNGMDGLITRLEKHNGKDRAE